MQLSLVRGGDDALQAPGHCSYHHFGAPPLCDCTRQCRLLGTVQLSTVYSGHSALTMHAQSRSGARRKQADNSLALYVCACSHACTLHGMSCVVQLPHLCAPCRRQSGAVRPATQPRLVLTDLRLMNKMMYGPTDHGKAGFNKFNHHPARRFARQNWLRPNTGAPSNPCKDTTMTDSSGGIDDDDPGLQRALRKQLSQHCYHARHGLGLRGCE